MKNNKLELVLKIICVILTIAIVITTSVYIAMCVMQKDVDALKAELGSAAVEIGVINDKYAAALQEIEALEGAQKQTNSELEDLKTEYNNTTSELEDLKTEYNNTTSELEALEKDVEAAEKEIDTLKDNYDVAKQEIESLKVQLEELTTPKIKIYIDQGHNPTSYHNAGASGNGLYEQDITFTIGVLLAELLEADGRFEVRLSRPTATTVLGTNNDSSLDARVNGAIEFGADYFISLHTNSYEDIQNPDKVKDVSGFEIFTVDESGESFDFGSSILNTLAVSTGLRNRGMKPNATFFVLKNATMPAILIEMGFISNPDDAKLMSEHPDVFAGGIYDGILEYFAFSKPEA